MNDVSDLTRERSGYAASIGACAMLELKIISCVAEHRRLLAQTEIESKKADAHRARIHEIELGDTSGVVAPPPAPGVTLVDYKPQVVHSAPATPAPAPALTNGSDSGEPLALS